MASLHVLDWAVCIGYLVVVFVMGLWFTGQQHTNEDYFVGGRKMHWIPIGLSIFAGMFSSLSFVGLPSEAAFGDYHELLGIMFIPVVVVPIVAWLFVPLFHRLGAVSGYAYLQRRFHRSLRLLASALYIGYGVCWMGNMLVAVGVLLQIVLNLTHDQTAYLLIAIGAFATLYTTMGGVKAVVWTDVLQAFALGGGMLLVLILAVGKIDGGWAGLWRVGMQYHKFDMFHVNFDMKQMNLPSACAFGFFVYLAGYGIQFKEIQRYMSMPSVAAARRSLAVNGVMIALTCAIFFLVGTAVFVYYHQGLPPGAQAGSGFPAMEKHDQMMPYFVQHVLAQPGLVGVLLAALFAAAMSSVDSGINSLTATIVYDWLSNRHMGVAMSRALCATIGAGAIVVAMVLFNWKLDVFDMVIGISGTFLGLLLGVFLLGMLTRRANAGGAWIGLLSGAGVLGTAMSTGIGVWWYSAIASVVTFAVGWLASWLFAAPTSDSLRGLVVIGSGAGQTPAAVGDA